MLIDKIKQHEGFKSKPYIDPLVATRPENYDILEPEMNIIKRNFNKLKVTFGYGFTFLTEDEATLVLNSRLHTIRLELVSKLSWIQLEPSEVQDVLVEMAYQIGVSGLLKFKKTLKYCKEHNYVKMSEEMLLSRWAKQTPDRAKELSNIIKGIK